MTEALYGPGGFFVAGDGPAAHFRTSVHVPPAVGSALLRLLDRVDAALGRPDRLDVVDVGAGQGELLATLAALAPPSIAGRLRLTAVELAPRPPGLPPTIDWLDRLPTRVTGLLVATEWLDNVPLEIAAQRAGRWHLVTVDPTTGDERVGGPVPPEDARWLTDWWPTPDLVHPAEIDLPGIHHPDAAPINAHQTDAESTDICQADADAEPVGTGRNTSEPGGVGELLGAGPRAEIGRPRDEAWAGAVAAVERGLALAVDYGHRLTERPADGTLTGYRSGRQVPPVPDGSCDLTAHVAVDSVASAGARVSGQPYTLLRQREALRGLGVDGSRPPLALAAADPAGYVRALAAASAVTELTDPAGLGAHWWLLQPVGIDPATVMAR